MLLPIGKRARRFFHSRSDCSSKTCHCSPLELVRLRCVFTNFTSFSLKFALTTIAGCTLSMPLAWQVLQIWLTYRGSLARGHTPNDKSPQTLQRATPPKYFKTRPYCSLGTEHLCILGTQLVGGFNLEVSRSNSLDIQPFQSRSQDAWARYGRSSPRFAWHLWLWSLPCRRGLGHHMASHWDN